MNNPHYTTLNTPVYTAAQTRQLDHLAIEQEGIAGFTLMQRAAEATFQQLLENYPSCKCVTVFCGIGNNGGDGYLIAKLAHEQGFQVSVYQLGDLSKQSSDALSARQAMLDAGVSLHIFDENIQLDVDVIANANVIDNVIVDAIFGTGLERDVAGEWLRAIQIINSSSAHKISVDIPSGLHSNTGLQLGEAVRAELTVTYIGRKQGLYTADGRTCAGRVVFDDLAIPAALYEQVPTETYLLSNKLSNVFLSPREINSHKGKHGHVLLVGGALGMSGAIMMAATAALRSGCGLVSVATDVSHACTVTQYQPEIMSHGMMLNDKRSENKLMDLINLADVIVLGPGLGKSEWSQWIYQQVINTEKPLILDADGLNLLAQSPQRKNNWILTPHPGEAAALLTCSTLACSNQDIQQDRFQAIKKIQSQYGGVCILKGVGTLISDGKTINICNAGNPGMASAGMGDVLSGVIAGLAAQAMQSSLTLLEVASSAVSLHALAADKAAQVDGEKGLLASDLFLYIRRLMNGI